MKNKTSTYDIKSYLLFKINSNNKRQNKIRRSQKGQKWSWTVFTESFWRILDRFWRNRFNGVTYNVDLAVSTYMPEKIEMGGSYKQNDWIREYPKQNISRICSWEKNGWQISGTTGGDGKKGSKKPIGCYKLQNDDRNIEMNVNWRLRRSWSILITPWEHLEVLN